jgi:hypothetical protein
MPQGPLVVGDARRAQSLELGVLFLAADIHALAVVGVGEPVRTAALHELPRGEAGPVQRLALEAGLREDLFRIGGLTGLHCRAPGERDGKHQKRVSHDGSFTVLWCFEGEPCMYPADFEAGYACCGCKYVS